MPTYLLESYGAQDDHLLPTAIECATRATRVGIDVRYVRTTLLPQECTLLHIFEAASPDELRQAARLADLSYDRIVEAVEYLPEYPDR